MKRLYTAFACLCLAAISAFSQNISLDQTSVSLDVAANETDVHSTLTMTNTAPSMKTFKWEREVVQISPSCQTQVCDPNNCYLPSISTKQFNLPGNGTGIMQVHFLNFTGNVAYAVVKIKITEVGNDANTITGTYIFNPSLVGNEEAEMAANIKLFPNPATDFFTLENAENVASVQIFNAEGRAIKQVEALPGESFGVSELPAGKYFLILNDKSGKAVRSMELQKN